VHRPHLPVLTLVPNHKEGRLMQMYKCIHPILSNETDPKKVRTVRAVHCWSYIASADGVDSQAHFHDKTAPFSV
jgi:hypothetical protein